MISKDSLLKLESKDIYEKVGNLMHAVSDHAEDKALRDKFDKFLKETGSHGSQVDLAKLEELME